MYAILWHSPKQGPVFAGPQGAWVKEIGSEGALTFSTWREAKDWLAAHCPAGARIVQF